MTTLTNPVPKQDLIDQLLQKKLSSHTRLSHQNFQISPLSYAQQRWWFLEELEPQCSAYNRSTILRLEGDLDLDALKSSINGIINRQTLLRVEIKTDDGKPFQQLSSIPPIEIDVVDLSDFAEGQREETALKECQRLVRQPFKLDTAPLQRFYLFTITSFKYLLLLVSHHILFDAWSEAIFIHDLLHLYESHLSGEPELLPPLTIDYFDAIAWQQAQLQSDLLQRQLQYWMEKLKNLPPLELPRDVNIPLPDQNEGASVNFTLSPALIKNLNRFGQEQGCTLFMVLLTGFTILLFKYTGQEDFAIDIPVANRPKPEFENIIGPFLNTLLLRSVFNGQTTVKELLQQVRETALEAFSNQDLHFEKLVESLHLDRNSYHQALPSVEFDFKNIPQQVKSLPHLTTEIIHPDATTSLFDISLAIYPNPADDYLCKMIYNTALFTPGLIKNLAAHFQNILNNMVQNRDGEIGRLDFLSPEEKQIILYQWNQTQKSYLNIPFPRLFERQAKLTPQAVALVYNHLSLTYGELLVRVNHLAGLLIQMGLKKGQFVLIYLEPSLEEVIAVLGVMRAGGVYVPVDPAYPLERIQYLLEDTQAKIILTLSALSRPSTLNDIQVIYLDHFWKEEHVNSDTASNMPWPEMDDPVYMIYTSGSSGNPKGVMVAHRSISNLFFAWSEKIYSTLPSGPLKISLNTFIAFDVSMSQIIMLASGHTLYIVPQNERFDGKALVHFIRKHRIEIFECVPSQLKLMLHEGLMAGDAGWQPLAVIFAGEAIDPGTWEQISRSTSTLFYNAYGPTECTVYASACCANHFPGQPLIGKPLSNIQYYILDPYLNPVPPGVAGELYIGGLCVAQGYHHQPALTSEKFIQNPFIPGEIIYKTGDKVLYKPDGNVTFLGRTDHQIKRFGLRMEPGEIEGVLNRFPGVHESVVIFRKGALEEQELAAYLILKNDFKININDLRDWLKSKLPGYMVPQDFVVMEKFPLLGNGKLDRKSLPIPQTMENDSWNQYSPPQTYLENELAKIWSDILHIDKVGIDDDFFELGGYSMLATQLFTRIQHLLLKKLPIATIFSASTVRKLAEIIEQETLSRWKYLVPIQPVGNKPPLFGVPGSPDDVFAFHQLVEYLDKERPFYGIQVNQLDEMLPPDLVSMARFFIHEIKTIQPYGPYHLIGHSWGGHLAYAMGCLLKTEGYDVAFLGLLDSRPRRSKIYRQVKTHVNNLKKISPAAWPKYIYQKIERRLSQLTPAGLSTKTENPPQSTKEMLLSRNQIAFENYQYPNYSGKLTLFKAGNDPSNDIYRWNKYCRFANVIKVGGNHNSIIKEPDVCEVAKILNQVLEEEQQK